MSAITYPTKAFISFLAAITSIFHLPVFVNLLSSAIDSSYISPLSYLEFTNANRTFVGLVDNGSQMNLIDVDILPFMQYVSMPALVPSFAGVQGHISEIRKWVSFTIRLANDMTTTVTAAAVDKIPCSIILGQPFLISNDIQIDSKNAIISTPKGPVKLLQRQRPPTPLVHTISSNLNSKDVQDKDDQDNIDLQHSNLTDKQKERFRQFSQKYRILWAGKRTGRANHIEHRIQVRTDHPIRDRPRYHTPDQNAEIEKQVNSMLANRVIQPSKSEHCSEIVMAKKKDADGNFTGWRFCIDFRNTNRATVKDAYPLPRITDLLHAIRKSQFFVALDLRSGYWQVPMAKNSMKYTAFRCLKGLFEFIVMPFGLTNAPATFQRLVDFLFGDLRHDGVLAYIDDILIHGATFDDVLGKLKIVFDRLIAEGLTLNLEKSNFFPRVLKYLGHTITDGTLSPNPAKVETLNHIKTPRTVHDVRRLLGMLGYYHPYIRNYSGLMTPVFELLKTAPNNKKANKETPVKWEPVHEEAAREAISRLRTSILTLPIETDDFLLEADASGTAVAAILSCKREDETWAPVEFASKKLSDTERRWPVRDLEAFAIVFGLKKFDTYLRGRSFIVHTDHKSLKWMLTTKEGRVARWASRMTEYDMTICHKSGTEVEHVDYLTRFVDDGSDFDVDERMTYYANFVRASKNNLPSIHDVLQEQSRNTTPISRGFFCKDNVIYFHNAIWVPPMLQTAVISACHSVAPYRHHGIKKTARLIRRVFNWPGLYDHVVRHIAACLRCQQTRTGLERLQGHFRTHPVVGPFHTVYMDYWKCTFNCTNYQVLTLIDQFTKWAECIPIPSTKAPIVVSAFIRSWICRFGIPEIVMCDNDQTFVGNLLSNVHGTFGTKSLSITPYHPEGNAVIESFHRTLNKGLTSFANTPNRPAIPFDEALQLVLYSYRSTIHTTTGESPAFLLYGADLRAPMDNDWRFQRDISMQQRLKFLNEMRLDIQWKAYDRRIRAAEAKNKHRIPTEFQLFQLVLVRSTEYDKIKYAHHSNDHKHKLTPKWSLPYRVITVYPGGKKALVRSLITRNERLVHIQDVRFLEPPRSKMQREEWEQILLKDIETMFDPQVREEKLKQFWTAIHYPQLDTLPPEATASSRSKRQCTVVSSSQEGW